MAADTLFHRITDYANRADPYPLYAELREARVARQEDGSYLVGTYHEIAALLHDPRISSDRRNRTVPDDEPAEEAAAAGLHRPRRPRTRPAARPGDALLRPAPHARTGSTACTARSPGSSRTSSTAFQGKERIDVVDDFAYPLPVTVICRLLGVPHRGRAALPRLGGRDRRRHRPHARGGPHRAAARGRGGPQGDGPVPGRARREAPRPSVRRHALRVRRRRRVGGDGSDGQLTRSKS